MLQEIVTLGRSSIGVRSGGILRVRGDVHIAGEQMLDGIILVLQEYAEQEVIKAMAGLLAYSVDGFGPVCMMRERFGLRLLVLGKDARHLNEGWDGIFLV